jgi:hypothetical protein
MKKIIRLLVLLLLLCSVAGVTSSCSALEDTHAQKKSSFKYKKPLPKRYIVNNGYKPILK